MTRKKKETVEEQELEATELNEAVEVDFEEGEGATDFPIAKISRNRQRY